MQWDFSSIPELHLQYLFPTAPIAFAAAWLLPLTMKAFPQYGTLTYLRYRSAVAVGVLAWVLFLNMWTGALDASSSVGARAGGRSCSYIVCMLPINILIGLYARGLLLLGGTRLVCGPSAASWLESACSGTLAEKGTPAQAQGNSLASTILVASHSHADGLSNLQLRALAASDAAALLLFLLSSLFATIPSFVILFATMPNYYWLLRIGWVSSVGMRCRVKCICISSPSTERLAFIRSLGRRSFKRDAPNTDFTPRRHIAEAMNNFPLPLLVLNLILGLVPTIVSILLAMFNTLAPLLVLYLEQSEWKRRPVMYVIVVSIFIVSGVLQAIFYATFVLLSHKQTFVAETRAVTGRRRRPERLIDAALRCLGKLASPSLESNKSQ